MIKGFRTPLFMLILVYLLTGCAPVISRGTMALVDKSLNFKEIIKDPELYRTRVVLLGGTILSTKNLPQKTMLEILEFPLDSFQKPITSKMSGGRFIAIYNGYLDPAIYSQGRLITIAGEVIGSKTRPLGETTYRYPLILIKEEHLWRQRPYGSSIQIGIGFSTTF